MFAQNGVSIYSKRSKWYDGSMDSIIAKSKIRQKILRLLFANGEKEFYLSEIARIAGTSAGNVQRELEKLKKEGVVTSKKKGNLRYYILDKKNPAFIDIENIIKKTIGIDAELSEVLGRMKGIDFAFIFGSYAKDKLKNESDIDLVVIGDPDEEDLVRKIKKIERSISREINYHLYTISEFRKKLKKSSFLQNITKKNLFLAGDKNEFKKIFR